MKNKFLISLGSIAVIAVVVAASWLIANPNASVSDASYVTKSTNQVQPDYTESNSSSLDFIKHKPTIPSLTWGAMTGTLSSQSDLQTALNAKEPTITAGISGQYWSGTKAWVTFPAFTQYWFNGTLQSATKHLMFTGTTTSGTVVFYMTNGGLIGGSAVCTAAPSNITVGMNDSGNTFGTSSAVTNSNKTLTVIVNARTFTSGNALLNLLGGLVNVLTGTTLTAAPNGTPISVAVDCI